MSGPSPLLTRLVDAGAGTGKTESLSRAILQAAETLFAQNKKIPKITATTFTERATAELRSRVITIAETQNSPDWLRQWVRDVDKLQISTIHGTYASILHQYGTHLGIDPQFGILRATDETEILRRALRDVVTRNEKYNQLFNQYSFQELMNFCRRLESHHSPESLTSQYDWKSEINQALGKLRESLKLVSSWDCDALSEKTKVKMNSVKNFSKRWMDKVDAKNLNEFGQEFEKLSKPSLRIGQKGEEFKDSLDYLFEISKEAASDSMSWDLNVAHEENSKLIQGLTDEVSNALRSVKKNRGLLSFDDLEKETYRLLKSDLDLTQEIRQNVDYWFIDEYQDTSRIQKMIFENLFQDPWNAYFVGDPQQSIYLFRNADPEVFRMTAREVQNRGGSLESLQKNYRSEPDLVKFFNYLFSDSDVKALVPKGPYEGKILTEVVLAEKELEVEAVVAQVKSYLESGFDFDDIAILVRTNSQALEISHALQSLNYPVFVHSNGGFYDRREILDALSLLTLLDDPSDDLAFVTLARSPWMGITDEDLAGWAKSKGAQSFVEYLSERGNISSIEFLKTQIEKTSTHPVSLVFLECLEKMGFFALALLGDPSGRKEGNLWKLLGQVKRGESQSGFSLTKFIREQKEGDSEDAGEASGFIEPKKINLMTIHKSKGLKFNCVIVPGCGRTIKKSPFRNLEITQDGQFAIRVPSRDHSKKVAPLFFKALQLQREKLEREEDLRVLYVAVTRAAKKLALIGFHDFRSESWFGKMKINYEVGDHLDQSYSVSEFAPTKLQGSLVTRGAEIPEKPGLIPWPTKENQNQSNVTELSSTQDWQKIPLKISLEAMVRGSVFHRAMEKWAKNSASSLSEGFAQALREMSLAKNPDLQLLEKNLEKSQIPWKELFSKGRPEWSFTVKNSEKTIRGQIDLWSEIDGEVWIIDYKTAAKDDHRSRLACEKQLQIYSWALSKFGFDRTKMKLLGVYLTRGEVVRYTPWDDRTIDQVLFSAAVATTAGHA